MKTALNNDPDDDNIFIRAFNYYLNLGYLPISYQVYERMRMLRQELQMDKEQVPIFNPRISWSEVDHEFNGYDRDGNLIHVSEQEFTEEWDDTVAQLVNSGYDRCEAERAASVFLSNPEEWKGKWR